MERPVARRIFCENDVKKEEKCWKLVDKNIAIYRPASPPRVSKVVAEVLRTLGKCIATSASGER